GGAQPRRLSDRAAMAMSGSRARTACSESSRALRRSISSPQTASPAGLAPTGLRPELVPSVEVVKVLPTVSNPAVLELEDNAVANIQVLAVSLRGAALDADHAVVIIRKQVLQLGLEGPSRLLPQPSEVGKGRLAALVVVGHRAPPRQVPHGALVEALGERLHVARGDGLVSA